LPEWRGCCLSIGNFDGLHRGHRQLLEALQTMAKRRATQGVVVTFYPHPAEVLAGKQPQRLMSLSDRVQALLAGGADGVWVIPFTQEYAALSAASFISSILLERLAVQGVVVGPDARFGAGRHGDGPMLAAAGCELGFEVVIVEPCVMDGIRVSSTEIRKLLQVGDVHQAHRMLGRNYRMKGKVVRGQQMGTRLGYPTANLSLGEDILVPACGIYIVRVRIGDQPEARIPYGGVANVGTRPTLDDGALAVEAHLFGVDGPQYGKQVVFEFLQRLREERKFGSIDVLKTAIAEDVRGAKEYFESSDSVKG
jgi:riboflavin kinase/FMN adenylyltransferase